MTWWFKSIRESLNTMFGVCGNCKRRFKMTAGQARRSQWASRPKFGFVCSRECASALGVVLKKPLKRLPVTELARSRANNAVANGKLIRPKNCQRCGRQPGLDKLGRVKIHAHHPDHSKALKVEWLCTRCHCDVTPKMRGTSHPNAKFTERQIRQIRTALLRNPSLTNLARRFNVTLKTIADIRDRKTWGHVS